jgi:phage-related protein
MKEIRWLGSSREDLRKFPKQVRNGVGVALRWAQRGLKHPSAKPLQGFGGAGVLEIVESWQGDAYRAVYTVRFADLVFVLHCFQKKSKRGAKTPRQDLNLIRARFRSAEEEHKEWLKQENKFP